MEDNAVAANLSGANSTGSVWCSSRYRLDVTEYPVPNTVLPETIPQIATSKPQPRAKKNRDGA